MRTFRRAFSAADGKALRRQPSGGLAVAAYAGDLDHRSFGREAGGARGSLDRLSDRSGSGLADRATFLADQEHDWIPGAVFMRTGDEGVPALDAMREAVVAEEIECPVDRDRRQLVA